jgi:hypothetical protein
VLVRFAYLAVTHTVATLRLWSMTDREKVIKTVALGHCGGIATR